MNEEAISTRPVSSSEKVWQVDPTMLKPDPKGKSRVLGLEDFFYKSAQYKRRLLIPSVLLFWVGILSAAVVVL